MSTTKPSWDRPQADPQKSQIPNGVQDCFLAEAARRRQVVDRKSQVKRLADVVAVHKTSGKPDCSGESARLTWTAQYLNSGILPNGSSTGLVRRFAAASA